MWPSYKAPINDGAAEHLRPGVKLPDVALVSTTGETVSLSQHHGPFIVFVYPWTGRSGFSNPKGWDDIPGAHGSTPEAEGFRDLSRNFQEKGVSLFGLSSQSTHWQIELSDRLKLPYPLLSDCDFHFSDALNLPRFTIEGVQYLKRLTLVCAAGKILHTVYPVHPPDRHAPTLLSSIESFLCLTTTSDNYSTSPTISSGECPSFSKPSSR